MPRKPVRPKNKRQLGLTETQLEYLINGHTTFSEGGKPFASDREAWKAWEHYRWYVMSLKGKVKPGSDHERWFNYGTRPYFWWKEMEMTPPIDQFNYLESHGYLDLGEEKLVDPAHTRQQRVISEFEQWKQDHNVDYMVAVINGDEIYKTLDGKRIVKRADGTVEHGSKPQK